MNKVMILGSLNMDLSIGCDCMPNGGETLQGFDFVMNAGGKGGNQAVACAKNGGDTWMIAQVGNDSYGQRLIKSLEDNHVNSRYVKVCEETTGVAVIIRFDHDNRILLSAGANHFINPDWVTMLLNQNANPGDLYLTQFENNFDAVTAGLKIASSLGMYTVVNPAPARKIDNSFYQFVDMIVVNQSEAETLCGIYPDCEASCMTVLDWFAEHQCDAIITMGTKGSIAAFQGNRYRVPACHVEVVDTTGAGDTYIGVLCSELAKQTNFEDALYKATCAAALTVTKMGAQCAIPTNVDTDQFIDDMRKNKLYRK